jgi:CheY-like chemotaxis protein
VLDLAMPFIDGAVLASRMRAAPEPPARLVALTALREHEMPLGARVLFDILLRKPADPGALRALMEGYAKVLGG